MKHADSDYWELMASNYPKEFELQLELRGRYVMLNKEYVTVMEKLSRYAMTEARSHRVYEIQTRKAALDNQTAEFLSFADVAALEELVYELRDARGDGQ